MAFDYIRKKGGEIIVNGKKCPSYLFGASFAILEKIEEEIAKCLRCEQQDFLTKQFTQLYLEEYKKNPGKTLLTIFNKNREYFLELKYYEPKIYKVFKSDLESIMKQLVKSYSEFDNFEQLQDFPFIVGYLEYKK